MWRYEKGGVHRLIIHTVCVSAIDVSAPSITRLNRPKRKIARLRRAQAHFYRLTHILCRCTLLPVYAISGLLLPYPETICVSLVSASLHAVPCVAMPCDSCCDVDVEMSCAVRPCGRCRPFCVVISSCRVVEGKKYLLSGIDIELYR
jgi:hypothetical protein